jgi:hypothetical protein
MTERMILMSRVIDLTGQDFGYWHVIERGPNTS